MTKFVFVNGEYVPESQANISVFDRGFLFADAIYEVVAFINGRLIDNERHLERMESSLQKINLTNPAKKGEIIDIQKGLIKRNGLSEGTVYIQISRGTAIRDFSFPNPASPSLVAFTQEKTIEHPLLANKGATVNLLPEIRWARRDIKTVGLLAQSMAKQTALDNGADDAWLVEKGFITEGSSSNAFIVDADGTIITHELSSSILPGITRQAVLEHC
jgi:D-alanine transaminase